MRYSYAVVDLSSKQPMSTLSSDYAVLLTCDVTSTSLTALTTSLTSLTSSAHHIMAVEDILPVAEAYGQQKGSSMRDVLTRLSVSTDCILLAVYACQAHHGCRVWSVIKSTRLCHQSGTATTVHCVRCLITWLVYSFRTC